MTAFKPKISCLILAGGEGKRVDGRDKGLINYQDKTLIQHAIDVIEPQTDEIVISANRNIGTYQNYGYEVITDSAAEYRGPLAGIAAALPHCKNNWVLIVPCDMPFLPSDFVEKLLSKLSDNNICIAESEGRFQLAFLINKNLLPTILQALDNNQLRLMQWVKAQKLTTCHFTETRYFTNFNQTKDLL